MTAAVLAIATEVTPGFTRFVDSCARQDVEPLVIEMGSEWRGFAYRGWPVARTLDHPAVALGGAEELALEYFACLALQQQ